jgi:dGTPase
LVEELERRYPEFPGLNLSYEVRESIVKHSAHGDRTRIPLRFHPDEAPLLEAVLVDEIDSTAYVCHDIDDGLRSGVISQESLEELPVWAGAIRQARDESPRGTAAKLISDRALRILLDSLLGDLLEHSQRLIIAAGLDGLAAVRTRHDDLVGNGPSTAAAKSELKSWLFTNLYRHWTVNRTFHVARRQLAELFAFLVEHPDSLPDEHRERIDSAGVHRTVADYLAGMTDRFAVEEHRRLFA